MVKIHMWFAQNGLQMREFWPSEDYEHQIVRCNYPVPAGSSGAHRIVRRNRPAHLSVQTERFLQGIWGTGCSGGLHIFAPDCPVLTECFGIV